MLYPLSQAKESEFVYLEIPKYGGHFAFLLKNAPYSYAEVRAFDFFQF
ncbi:hypothetical protein [Formosa sp. PL04]|nr:hypothetical protein [Formosa sp. PL04]MDW5288259.1 hypothetical protein [Formosa sp. PL04]